MAIEPSDPNAIAGSLFPVEFAMGEVVTPGGGVKVADNGVFENGGIVAVAVA